MSCGSATEPPGPDTGPREARRRGDSPALADAVRPHADWRAAYARRLWTSDLAVLTLVAFGTQIAWFGLGNAQVSIREDSRLSVVSYWFFSALLVVAWMWSLSLIDSRSDRAIGTGSAEYIRIISVSIRLFGIIAILAFLLRVDVARGYLLIAFPLGMAVPPARALALAPVARREARARRVQRPRVLVGSESSVAQISEALRRTPSAGYLVVGACVPRAAPGGTVRRHRHPRSWARCCRSRTRSRAVQRRHRRRLEHRRAAAVQSSSASRGSSRRVASTSCSRRASSTSSARASRPARSPDSR